MIYQTFPCSLFQRRKSQIQTYLEQNEGAGLQHLALKTDDIFSTIREMRKAEENFCDFELMKRPSDKYYRELPDRLGDNLSVSGREQQPIFLFDFVISFSYCAQW